MDTQIAMTVVPKDELPKAAALWMEQAISARIEQSGNCAIAFSGGSTPTRMFDHLARAPVDWSRVTILQVDERMAPAGHPDNNYTALREHLVDRLPVAPAAVLPVDTDLNPEAAARAYERALEPLASAGIDLVHLGLGDDGHTASWPPGDSRPLRSARLVEAVGPYRGYHRITLTPKAVRAAESILWLVAGADKASALRQLIEGDPSIPATSARTSGSTILCDPEAAGLLD